MSMVCSCNANLTQAQMQAAFLPSNTPEEIVAKLFNVFSHRHTSREMSFDDFLAMHYLLSPTDNVSRLSKRGRLYFYIFADKDA